MYHIDLQAKFPGLSNMHTLVKTMRYSMCRCVTTYRTKINVVYMNHRGVCPVFQTSTSVTMEPMAAVARFVRTQTDHSAVHVGTDTVKMDSSAVKVCVYLFIRYWSIDVFATHLQNK
jgi:hypothetical protein